MIELPRGYYLTNFLELVDYVFEQYEDLLSEPEIAFYQGFKKLKQESQYLYVRMLTRKGLVFREKKLSYEEIPDIGDAALTLEKANLIELNPPLTAESLLNSFNKSEWLKILQQLDLDNETQKSLKSLSRPELDEILINVDEECNLYSLIDEPVYLLCESEHFETYKLLFFGNLHQDLTEFVLRDLGLYKFEDYHIDKRSRLFSSRQQIDNYLSYYNILDDLEDALSGDEEDINQFFNRLPDAKEQDDVLNRRLQKVYLTLARQLERLEALESAMTIYEHCVLEPSRERQARILLKQEKVKESLCMCQNILNAPLTESEEIFAREFGYRTAKKHKIDWAKPSNYQPDVEIVTLEQTEDSVEINSANHLAQNGECFYVENGLFLSLFGLHFWPVIFAPIRGAFTNPFQFRPHDLYDENFLVQRNEQMKQCIKLDIPISERLQQLKLLINKKSGTASPFVFWELIDESLLSKALERIPQGHWAAIFDRIWRDLRQNRSGFPDLIWFPESGGYQLIEVKGPGDKLQKNQIRWMQYFSQHNIPHKVLNVEWL